MMTSRDPYESECFSYVGTTFSEPPTSTANESPSRASMMSPMPGQTEVLFTDFGIAILVRPTVQYFMSLNRWLLTLFVPQLSQKSWGGVQFGGNSNENISFTKKQNKPFSELCENFPKTFDGNLKVIPVRDSIGPNKINILK